jgi:hypothetical protein
MKLTERQKELMECIDKYSYNGYFYAECGGWKPFNVKTIKSLVDKGLIDFHRHNECTFWDANGVYFLVRKKEKINAN